MFRKSKECPIPYQVKQSWRIIENYSLPGEKDNV
jgi:hypothetical protein